MRLVLAALILSAVSARGEDHPVLGQQLMVRNPGTPERRKIVVKARESPSDDFLTSGDPRVDGATLTITLDGSLLSSQTFVLPGGTSAITAKPFWSGDLVAGASADGKLQYKDPKGENGPVKAVAIKQSGKVHRFTLKVQIDGKLGAVTVLPPNPGTDGCALLAIEDGDSFSVSFANGTIANNGVTLFRVSKPPLAASCVPATTTTTSTTTSTTALPSCGDAAFPTCGGACALDSRCAADVDECTCFPEEPCTGFCVCTQPVSCTSAADCTVPGGFCTAPCLPFPPPALDYPTCYGNTLCTHDSQCPGGTVCRQFPCV
jgi:hypothetical protein